MTETATKPEPRAPLSMGGDIVAVIPKSFDEMSRIARGAIEAGLAPKSMTDNKTPKEATAAVAIMIMAGAELNLPPMAALRSFTVINGKPALYGDGLIGVIRRTGKAEYIRVGFEAGKTERYGDDAYGWCEAKRADTGETLRYEFTVEDAKRAGLWQDKAIVTKRKRDGGTYEAPNDSPWFRFPRRMIEWRAVGYCLRALFADILMGVIDGQEAIDLAVDDFSGDTIDAKPSRVMPPSPPPAPADDKAKTEEEASELVDAFGLSAGMAGSPDAVMMLFEKMRLGERLSEYPAELQEALDIQAHHVKRTTFSDDEEEQASSD